MISIRSTAERGTSSAPSQAPEVGRKLAERPSIEQLDDAALGAQAPRDAPHRQVGQGVVVDQVKAHDVAQRLAHRAVTPALEVRGAQHLHHRRGRAHPLHHGARHGDVDRRLQQVNQVLQLRFTFGRRRGALGRRGAGEGERRRAEQQREGGQSSTARRQHANRRPPGLPCPLDHGVAGWKAARMAATRSISVMISASRDVTAWRYGRCRERRGRRHRRGLAT